MTERVVGWQRPAAPWELSDADDPIRQVAARWRLEPLDPGDRKRRWVGSRAGLAETPVRGWKLHLSGGLFTAAALLDRAVPLLLAERVSFKCTASLRLLAEQNNGRWGARQVGKLLTVYPRTVGQAIALAASLDEATHGLAGPRIPAEPQYRPGSAVSYRYGRLRSGRERPTDDTRAANAPPDDPFQSPTGASDGAGSESGPFGARLIVLRTLRQAPKGGVYLALDLEARPPRRCIVKEARHHVDEYPGGDARSFLAHEGELLRFLTGQGEAVCPAVLDTFTADDNRYLLLDVVPGRSLHDALEEARATPASDRIDPLTVGVALCDAVAVLHRHGIAHGDLTPSNVMLTPQHGVRLLDLSLARRFAPSMPPLWRGGGTAGYRSPEQRGGAPVSPADDVYALGTIIAEIVRTSGGWDAHGARLRRIVRRARAGRADRRYTAIPDLRAQLIEVP